MRLGNGAQGKANKEPQNIEYRMSKLKKQGDSVAGVGDPGPAPAVSDRGYNFTCLIEAEANN
jgi:hypothetical protein